jgi:hypothetical protein
MTASHKLTTEVVSPMILKSFSSEFVGIRDRDRRRTASKVARQGIA